MNNEITYGPHLFPGGPELYIRTGEKRIYSNRAHEKIKKTLDSAFSNESENSITSQMSKQLDFDSNSPVNLSFMNYGNTELVYLTTFGNKLKFATLINQPRAPLGEVKSEYDNLQRLVEIDSHFVIKPFAYFNMEKEGHELYTSEYVDNALCIAINGGHGIYNPLPLYHFERFSSEISHKVNSNMIALLVNYYDSDKGRGLSKTQTSGNDFMFTRNFKRNDASTIQPNIRLISARGFIDVSLDEYIDIIKREFLFGTTRDNSSILNMRVNTRSGLAMTKQDIKEGIELGLELREQHK